LLTYKYENEKEKDFQNSLDYCYLFSNLKYDSSSDCSSVLIIQNQQNFKRANKIAAFRAAFEDFF